jgi:hypothetical protein
MNPNLESKNDGIVRTPMPRATEQQQTGMPKKTWLFFLSPLGAQNRGLWRRSKNRKPRSTNKGMLLLAPVMQRVGDGVEPG